MKNISIHIMLFALFMLLFTACEDALDKSPVNSYSDESVWSDINLASTYLLGAYNEIAHDLHGTMSGAMTDEILIGRGPSSQPYNTGEITADRIGNVHDKDCWERCFENIQKINLFLQNIENISSYYDESERSQIEEQASVLKGEAVFLRAWEYHCLMRSYGGVPLIDSPFTLESDFLTYERSSFEETVNFIVDDCDEAADLLMWKADTEMGRATREAAMALKSRVLLFAASDLTADGNAQSNLVGYENPDREALWTAARDAAKAVIDLPSCELSDFGAPDKEAVAENYHLFFAARDLSSEEVIWGRMFLPDVGERHNFNTTSGPNGYGGAGRNGPMQQMVDSYQMEDGSSFQDHFTLNENNEYINISTQFTNENPYYNRDPRFYGSVYYDSAKYLMPRWENLIDIDPVGIYDRRTRIVIENGQEISSRPGLDTRGGPYRSWNGNYCGYLTKKFTDPETVTRDEKNENIYIYIRYAEIILNYAEACLELGDIATATEYINMIRNRAAMPDFTGDVEDALRYERKIELYQEDSRWYDIRRWKILMDVMDITPAGIDITEITEDGVTTTTWKRIDAQEANNTVEKMYWLPIESSERKRAPQLDQNPGY